MHADLDQRLQARALVLAIEPRFTARGAAEALVAMAGASPAAPIAARRALARLETANLHRPSERTERAIEALALALAAVQERLPPRRGRLGDDAARERHP
ncbi:MAG TPA: hypothetical protein VHM89_13820 [Acidimicrobiales bacterium]|nr:hypothetical protein [Acidimicrobiales bacterium]